MVKPRKAVPSDLSVGAMAERAGVPVSTLHYYEAEGLIKSWRTPTNHRRYNRSELRRVAVIRVAQALGIPLSEVGDILSDIPHDKIVSAEDWGRASRRWKSSLNERIVQLQRLRDELDSCIGCGCLSLDRCPLYNPADRRGKEGPGPRNWLSEEE
ncbi:redox-sensitive transcriptional activator SoxR [Pseudoprimorskyibacter insulae]|uniref:Redox-sensitive transcriptional activator SoxR n=1 Tax=Pseudoprimorskyibacter insulae TaxID=1695997 RepID=A0A2R8AWN8_9RHOB|nr:redox-sensitive transcriptional activator SoxR [Pseudoprimorskyibacter insulae]SPF80456.1 Redox-sensitive transcriptional activator SoxR [Pseudoprimorskyibacter insulae]